MFALYNYVDGLIIIILLVPLILLVLFSVRSYLYGSYVEAVVLLITALHEFLLIVFPCLYAVVSRYKYEAELNISPTRLLTVVMGEAVYIGSFLYVFLMINMFSKKHKNIKFKNEGVGRNEIFVSILLLGGLLLYIHEFISPPFSYDDMATHADIVIKENIFSTLLDWIFTFFRWPGIIAATLVVSSKYYNKHLRILSITVIIMGLGIAIINGVRGGITLIIELIIFGALINNSRRIVAFSVVLGLLILPFMPWVQEIMRYQSASAAYLGVTRAHMFSIALPSLKDFIYDGFRSSRNSTFVESWAIRAEGPRNSVGLYNLYDGDEGAGFKAVWGAILLPIPRMIWTEKPVAGSTDSTNLGAAIYRVQQLKPDTSPQEMGPILASAHAYWEGGFLAIILLGLITGIFWAILLNWADSQYSIENVLISMCFTAALPIDGFLTALNPIYTIILMTYKLFPLFLLILVTKSYNNINNKLVA
jgi:hypothetical protein